MKITESFRLSQSFLDQYRDKEPDFGPLGLVTYARTYSRTKEDETQERFWETVKRVVEVCYSIQKTHCKNNKLPWNETKAQHSAQEMFRRMFSFKFLPPGRGLWAMDVALINKVGSAALNNCAFVSTKDIKYGFAEPFVTLMDFSMLGVGVGFDTEGAGTLKVHKPTIEKDIHVVDDTREGWTEIVKRTLNAYVGIDTLPSSIDFSQVRPAGEPIKTFGGIASGPGPLKELVENIQTELNKLIGLPMTSECIVDLMNMIGKCVVSGNVRRSAELALGYPDDETFLNLKNPQINSQKLDSHRWASNNSIIAKIGMDYSKVAELTAMNGEPGYFWIENARQYSRMNGNPDMKDARVTGCNPCAEQMLESFELCNLVETYPVNHENFDDYKKTLKYAYLYAKTVTLIPTNNEKTNAIMLRNRRIGTSMSGIVQAMAKLGKRKFFNWCELGYTYLRELDKIYSEWLCVPESIKITTVKPSGTVSLLPGCTPGIHFPHSQFYIRRIRFQENSPLVQVLKDAGYYMEKDAYSPNTVVVEFPVESNFFEKSKNDVTMWEQLELAAQMQESWSDNAVSVTVTFKPEESKDIKTALELFETRLKTVSFLPFENHGYVQLPYEEISKEIYLEKKMNIKEIDLNKLYNINTHEVDEKFCTNDICEIKLK